MVIFVCTFGATAQHGVSLTALDVSLNSQEWYDTEIGLSDTQLQIGVMGNMTQKIQTSHPFYQTNTWTYGGLNYRHQVFEQIPLVYNLETDAIFIKKTVRDGLTTDQPIALNAEQVESFTIFNKKFIYLNEKVDAFTSGFLELIYEGEMVSLLAKRTKEFEIDDNQQLNYLESHKYYLQLDGSYYRIRKLSKLRTLFKAQKKEIKSYAKKNRIEVCRPETDEQFKQLIVYCNQLLTSK